jgi:hypothetical protein
MRLEDRIAALADGFSPGMPIGSFLLRTLAVSLWGLGLAVLGYVAVTPGLAAALAGGGDALVRFLRQVLTNGLPVVFVMNFAGFFLCAAASGWRGLIPADIALRAALFIGLHALVYVLSADWFGSFGGDRGTALRVVGPTLAEAASGRNLAGAYLYASASGALPVYVLAVRRSPRLNALTRRLPAGPVLLAAAFFGILGLTITILARALPA